MKNTIIVFFLLLNLFSYSQIKEGQNFCEASQNGSYFPLSKNNKIIYWSNTYYVESIEGEKEIKGKTYLEYKQTWEDGNISTLYLRKNKGITYQYEECCKEETIRFDENSKKGNKWKTADKKGKYEILTFEGKLKTPFCEYTNLLVIQSELKYGTFNFYYMKGHGYIGATKNDNIISCLAPFIPKKKKETGSEKSNTPVKTDFGIIEVPGSWEVVTHTKDSNQYFLKNSEGVIIAIALNPKTNYSFYKPSKNDTKLISDYYKWEYDYRIENNFKISKIKSGKKGDYIIWKFEENNIDNVLLYSTKSSLITNYLVYTDKWNENEKILFLEKIHALNN